MDSAMKLASLLERDNRHTPQTLVANVIIRCAAIRHCFISAGGAGRFVRFGINANLPSPLSAETAAHPE
jgi:hypothetical protein